MLYLIDPLSDSRWPALVQSHERASIFHTPGWLATLKRTYGYTPAALTTSPPGEPLRDGLAFCHVDSWLTKLRLVSLPFSDHCALLTAEAEGADVLISGIEEQMRASRAAYWELRCGDGVSAHNLARYGQSYGASISKVCCHRLDLRPSLERIFESFHRSCIQKKVQRAEREALHHESGNQDRLLRPFYQLLIRTRRRHGLPPQPVAWFRYLMAEMGERLRIHVAWRGSNAVAAMLTLEHNGVLVYKYGCSDAAYHSLGGIPFLFWRVIQEAKGQKLAWLDLGRSDWTTPGLIEFKERLGAERSILTYLRQNASGTVPAPGGPSQLGRAVKGLLVQLPDHALSIAGSLIYKHIG